MEWYRLKRATKAVVTLDEKVTEEQDQCAFNRCRKAVIPNCEFCEKHDAIIRDEVIALGGNVE
jgi:hypothetical protein